jgi:iduronate 2-sulfatase
MPSYRLESSIAAYKVDDKGKRRGPPTERADVSDDDYSDGQIASEAMKRLNQLSQDNDQPFFLAVGFQKPHLPFVAPEKYWAAYDPGQLPMPEVLNRPKDAPEYAGQAGGELRNYSGMKEQWPVDQTMTRHLIHGYYAATSYVDAQI